MTATAIALLADTDWGHMDGGWWIVMMLGMVIFWGLVIALGIWLLRGGAIRNRASAQERLTPLETLDHRFAEGSITADEYHERREILRGSSG
jgi:putative membrane protein